MLLSPHILEAELSVRLEENDTEESQKEIDMSQKISEATKLPDFTHFKTVLDCNSTLLSLIDWKQPTKTQHLND